MVIFKELQIDGFKKYNHKKTFQFDEGLMGIFGKNESGKSTIGDALTVSLFGVSSTSYNKSEVVTWGKSKANLRLDFEVDKLYRVERSIGSRSTAKLQIYDNNRWETIENTIKSVDNRIQDILGLDFKSFKNSIFIGQNDLDSLSSLSKQERQSIINRLSRYDELSKAEILLKQKIKEIKQNLELLNKDFDNLKEIVKEKDEKKERLEKLSEDKSVKIKASETEEIHLNDIKKEIKILDQLKIIKTTNDNITSLNKLIDEKNSQISSIEAKELTIKEFEQKIQELDYVNENLKLNIENIEKVNSQLLEIKNLQKEVEKFEELIQEKNAQISSIKDKESQKEDILKELNQLEHVNEKLQANIEQVGIILSDLDKLENSQADIRSYENSIKEKNSLLTRIENQELEKEKLQNELKAYAGLTPELKNKIEDIARDCSKLKEIKDVKLETTKNNIIKLQKNIKDSEKIIGEKQSQLDDINSKEVEIGQIKLKLQEYDYLDQDLKSLIDSIGAKESDLKSNQTELNRIEKEINSKSKFLDDEDKLKEADAKYARYLELKKNLDLKTGEINKTQADISTKKNELGELIQESGDLKVVESNLESKISSANIMILAGIGVLIIGLVIGFIFNLFLILISLIGILPLYKGYTDKNNYNSKLKVIKDKRETFGYLKQLEKHLSDLKAESQSFEREIRPFEKMDLESLKKNSQVYRSLEKEIIDFNKLKESENQMRGSINQIKTKLNQLYHDLPSPFNEKASSHEGNSHKVIYDLYQEEDKKKSNYLTKLKNLESLITEKPAILSKIKSYEEEKGELITQLGSEEGLLQDLRKNEIELKTKLESSFNQLPVHYTDKILLSSPTLDKELLGIYQDEDKVKSNLDSKIENLDIAITEKEDILIEKDQLITKKQKLENHLLKESKRLKEDLEANFNLLPITYQENTSFDDVDLYKTLSSLYQKESRKKNTLETQVKGLDEEISKKEGLEADVIELVDNKIKLEERISQDDEDLNAQLRDSYGLLPEHYQEIPITQLDLVKKLNELYQIEDKQKSNYEDRIQNLTNEIAVKEDILTKFKKLNQEKENLNDVLLEQKQELKKMTNQENLEYDSVKYENLLELKKSLQGKIGDINKEIWSLEGDIRTLSRDTQDLDDKKAQLNVLDEEILKERFEMDVNEIAKTEISFTAQSLREQVMDRTTKYVAIFLPKITNNKYRDVKISEDFKIKVYSPEKNDFESINSLSGGARDQVLFAFRLAFTQAIVGGRSRSKGFALFLDEFLGSFDHNRRNKTLRMLKELKDYFRQIFLISHIEGMEMDVDQVIKTPET